MKIFISRIRNFILSNHKKTLNVNVYLFAFLMIVINPIESKAQFDKVTLNVNQLDLAANLWYIEDIVNMITIDYNDGPDTIICIAATITNLEKGSFVCVKGENYELSSALFPQPVIRSNFGNTEITGDDPNYTNYIKEVADRTGTLPAGSYEICVEAYPVNECKCAEAVECIKQEIFNPSPPELIYPADESEISEELPLFSWLPPMPSYGMESYTLQIVEINDGQSAIEAMDANSPWFIKDDIDYNSFQLSLAEREFISGQRYAWRVSASIGPKGEKTNAIVVSSVQSFTYRKLTNELNVITDPNFNAACNLLKDNVDIKDEAKIYGVIDPIPEGATIESEEISDFERMRIENEPFLFIIDDEPGERFGHPVHYVLVDTEFNTVKIFDANWWPVVRHSINKPEVVAEEANIGGMTMTLTTLTEQKNNNTEQPIKKNTTNAKKTLEKFDIESTISCSKWILIVDGGDYDRLIGGTNETENASTGASKAKLLEELYKPYGYKFLHFSQRKTEENNKLNSLDVGENRSAANTIKTLLDTIKTVYVSNNCCGNSVPNLEVGIYIWANALQNTSNFKIYNKDFEYTPTGEIANEDVDYGKDILTELSKLDPCVKITLFDIEDCFTGKTPAKEILQSYIDELEKRQNLNFANIKELREEMIKN